MQISKMKRNEFIKLLTAGGAAIGSGSFVNSCATSVKDDSVVHKLPRFWLWVRPQLGQSDDQWKRTFAEIKDLGIEAVLIQIYSSHKALFHMPGYEVEEPLLERLIPLAHQAGVQIHAWMWTMPCNDKRIIEAHPDWYVVNRNGQPSHSHPAYVGYYKFLCPRKPEVRSFVKARVKTLAAISELDGIHLDYVRMPDVILAAGLQPNYDIVQDKEYAVYDYCYCDTCRNGYQVKTGHDPMDIKDHESDKSWYQYRYDAVVDLVNEYLVPAAKAKDKIITAAVFPNWESVRQQWHEFDLDAFLPMLYHGFYNEDLDWIGEETENAIKRLSNSKPIYAGLFVPHLEEGDMDIAVNSAMKGGAKGFSLFAYGNLDESGKQEVKKIIAEMNRLRRN